MGIGGLGLNCCGCAIPCTCLQATIAGIVNDTCMHCVELNETFFLRQDGIAFDDSDEGSCFWRKPTTPAQPQRPCCGLAATAQLVRDHGRWKLRLTATVSSGFVTPNTSVFEYDFGSMKPDCQAIDAVPLSLVSTVGNGGCDLSAASVTVSSSQVGTANCYKPYTDYTCWCGDDVPTTFVVAGPPGGPYVLNRTATCTWHFAGPPWLTLYLGWQDLQAGYVIQVNAGCTDPNTFPASFVTYLRAIACSGHLRCGDLSGIVLPYYRSSVYGGSTCIAPVLPTEVTITAA